MSARYSLVSNQKSLRKHQTSVFTCRWDTMTVEVGKGTMAKNGTSRMIPPRSLVSVRDNLQNAVVDLVGKATILPVVNSKFELQICKAFKKRGRDSKGHTTVNVDARPATSLKFTVLSYPSVIASSVYLLSSEPATSNSQLVRTPSKRLPSTAPVSQNQPFLLSCTQMLLSS